MDPSPHTSTSRPQDVIQVIGVPRPSPFFLPLPGIILNENQKTKNGRGLETRLVRSSKQKHLKIHLGTYAPDLYLPCHTQIWLFNVHKLSMKYLQLKHYELRTFPWRVHKMKYLTPMNGIYAQAGFHNGQASYLSMKVLVFCRTWAYTIFF